MADINQVQREKLTYELKKILGILTYLGTLGDSDDLSVSTVDEPGRPGWVRVRLHLDDVPFRSVKSGLLGGYSPYPGLPVVVGYDEKGDLAIKHADHDALIESGVNPLSLNSGDTRLKSFNQTDSLLPLWCGAVSEQIGTASTKVAINSYRYVDTNNVTHWFQGLQEELAASIPGANLHRYVAVFLRADETIQITASTPKATITPLQEADKQECFAARDTVTIPIWLWRLHDNQTSITNEDKVEDLRPWLRVSSGITADINNIAEADMLVRDAVNNIWINVPILKDKKELIGFAEGSRVKATLSFDNPTRTLTVSYISDYNIYDDSVMYPITGDLTRQISDDEGQHYIYYQNGALTSIHAPSAAERLNLFSILALTAIVYWDKTNQKIIYDGEERHGTNIPGSVHKESHFTRGTWYYNNGGLGFSNFAIDGSGNDDSNVHFAVANGTVYDEDIEHNISNANQTLSPIAEMPIYYLDGTNWRRFWIDTAWQDAHAYSLGDQIRGDDSYFEVTTAGTSGGVEPTWAGNTEPGDPVVDNTVTWTCIGSPRANVRNFVGGTYRLAYNQLVGASWQQTEVNNGSFVLAHVMATNNLLDNQLMVVIQGQAQYSTIIAAREGATNEVNELQTIGLPFAEFVFIGTVTYQTSNGYSNEAKGKIRTTDTGADYVDFRFSSISSGGGTVSDHNTLGGLELAGPGVTYGHIDDQVQTIAGAKTLTGKLTHQDSATIAPINVTERSAAPSAPVTEDVYLDDGTNTASGNPGWRRYAGAVWEDISAGAASAPVHYPFDARLTLSTGVAVTTSDVTGTTVYLTPYKGNTIALYNGSTAWADFALTEISITNAGLAVDNNYDVFVYDSSGLTLELVVWTNDTTRATAIVLQDGVYVKSGTTTKRYVGTIRTYDGGGGTVTFADKHLGGAADGTSAKLFVYNYYKRLLRPFEIHDDTDSWTYSTATYRIARAQSSNMVEIVQGVQEDIVAAKVIGHMSLGNNEAGSATIGIDSSTTPTGLRHDVFLLGTVISNASNANLFDFVGLGYHDLRWIEIASVGTITFFGDAGGVAVRSGIAGYMWG